MPDFRHVDRTETDIGRSPFGLFNPGRIPPPFRPIKARNTLAHKNALSADKRYPRPQRQQLYYVNTAIRTPWTAENRIQRKRGDLEVLREDGCQMPLKLDGRINLNGRFDFCQVLCPPTIFRLCSRTFSEVHAASPGLLTPLFLTSIVARDIETIILGWFSA
ncbi:hypothetical protein C8R43DRAFT_951692 [Mycena crocata]|nr:hypothetical protein C8R43DRAFT_951692 [Mycena crocata]